MSGRASVEKGKRGEREIVRALQPIVDRIIGEVNEKREREGGEALETVRLLRNSLQSAVGGHDIIGFDWLSLEVKYQETTFLTNWWHQCLEQTEKHQIAVLLHRKNGARWRCRMNGFLQASNGTKILTPVDISFEAFILWFEHELRSRYV